MKLNLIIKKLIVIFIIGALLIGFSFAFLDVITFKECQQPFIFCGDGAPLSYDYELRLLPTYLSNLWQGFVKTVQNPKVHIWEFIFSLSLISLLFYFFAKLLKWNEKRIISRFE